MLPIRTSFISSFYPAEEKTSSSSAEMVSESEERTTEESAKKKMKKKKPSTPATTTTTTERTTSNSPAVASEKSVLSSRKAFILIGFFSLWLSVDIMIDSCFHLFNKKIHLTSLRIELKLPLQQGVNLTIANYDSRVAPSGQDMW